MDSIPVLAAIPALLWPGSRKPPRRWQRSSPLLPPPVSQPGQCNWGTPVLKGWPQPCGTQQENTDFLITMVGWFPGETCDSPCPAPNPTPVLAHPAGVYLCSHRYLHPSPMKQQPAGRAAAGEHHPIPTLSQQPTPQRSIIPTLQSKHSSRSQTLCAGTLTCRVSKSQQCLSLTRGAPRAGTAQLLEGDTARCFLLHWAFSKQPAALDRRALIEPIPCSSCLCRAVPRVQGTSPYPKELLTPATMRPLKASFLVAGGF